MQTSEVLETLTELKNTFAAVARKKRVGDFEAFFLKTSTITARTATANAADLSRSKLENFIYLVETNPLRAAENVSSLKGAFDQETNTKIDQILNNLPEEWRAHLEEKDRREKETAKKNEEKAAFEKSFEGLLQAVKDHDVPLVQKTFNTLKDSDYYSPAHKDDLLRAVIKADSLDLLGIVHDFQENPNYKLSSSRADRILNRSAIPRTLITVPLLFSAISNGAESIAVALAKNPKTDIYAEYLMHSPRFTRDRTEVSTTRESILDSAEAKGMTSVIDILRERVANDLEQQAKSIRSGGSIKLQR